jgi:hypothetical protein
MKSREHKSAGGTGFQPVVSGILPETWGSHHARGRTNIRSVLARANSGRMPELTGWKPVPPTDNAVSVAFLRKFF